MIHPTLTENKERTGNISYPSSAAAVVFGMHLSAQFRVLGIDRESPEIRIFVKLPTFQKKLNVHKKLN